MIMLQPIPKIHPRYIRTGKCNRCGWCCESENCEHFNPSENGNQSSCNIHDGNRPQKCIEFPANPPILYEECGHRFYDRWENKLLGVREV